MARTFVWHRSRGPKTTAPNTLTKGKVLIRQVKSGHRPDGADARESRGARPQASPERGDAPGFAVAARHDQESPSPGDGDQGQGVVPCQTKRSACTTWRPRAVRIATASGSAAARDRAPARRRARATRASRRGRATTATAETSRTSRAGRCRSRGACRSAGSRIRSASSRRWCTSRTSRCCRRARR